MIPRARAAGTSRKLNHVLPRANTRRPLVAVRTSPAIDTPVSGGRATFQQLPVRIDGVSSLNRATRRGFGPGTFFSIGALGAAGQISFTTRKPGSDTRRVGAKAFHGSNHRSIHVSEIAQVVSGTTHEYRG